MEKKKDAFKNALVGLGNQNKLLLIMALTFTDLDHTNLFLSLNAILARGIASNLVLGQNTLKWWNSSAKFFSAKRENKRLFKISQTP